ncbi:unnamed protein product [Mytilus edulis]|uniref:DUF4371 domain-containing protein n=1 Tax=Mytilus edulis TaxID=6550 RepID=A0A8S3T8X0_MYTED|nr:unnamed protein product [Mytilus edulis]
MDIRSFFRNGKPERIVILQKKVLQRCKRVSLGVVQSLGPPTDVTEEFDINENVVNVTNSTTRQSTCSSLSAPDNVSSLNLSSNALSPEAHKLLIEQQFPNIDIRNPLPSFYSFFFLAKESIANCKIVQFLKFIEHIGLNDLKYFTHRSVQSRRDILLKLSDTVQNNLLEKLHSATSYGLLIDDMSDVATIEQMICYVQYVDPDSNEVNTDFLFICNLLENSDSANSQTLFDVLCMKLNELQMDVKKISGLCTDGASVMVGKKDGLASKLKKENSSLIAVHCICHRLALACTDTNVKLKSIGNVEQIMLQLWKLFHYSPK